MLRSQIARGLANLVATVDATRVQTVIEQVYRDVTRQTSEAKTLEVLEAYQKFVAAYHHQFSAVEHKLMVILEIAELADNEWWTTIIMAAGGGPKAPDLTSRLGHPLFRLRFVMDYLPSVIDLIKQEDAAPLEGEAGRLVVLLPEAEGRRSSPARVTASIDAVALLYEAYAEIDNVPTSDLVIVSCDSGADKSFEFSGRADLIKKVRAQLLEIWRNAIYYRERKFAERVDLIAAALPLQAEINGLEKAGRIEPERAELLRRKINLASAKFIESGSSIPEMSDFSLYVPRQVLAPKETLLLAATL